MVDASKAGFCLTPQILCQLHSLVIQDLYTCAGKFREAPVYLLRDGKIDPDKHQPPAWEYVGPFVEEMCKYVNENFGKSGVHLAAYLMWRINWIHPFLGGNGRTTRGAAYLVLNVRLGFNLPGVNTIAQQIEANRTPYYEALQLADGAYAKGIVDISAMEEMIKNMLAAQLLSVHDLATGAPQ